jgi:hypothetical protein
MFSKTHYQKFAVLLLIVVIALVAVQPAAAAATAVAETPPLTLPDLLAQVAQQLVVAFFLALVNERLVAALVAPVKQKWPTLDYWWLIYPSWILGGLIVYASGINLFGPFIPDPIVGKLLTAAVGGGGANLLHDIFDPKTG